MRKAQKKEAEGFIEVLARAHGAIKKAIRSDISDMAMDLLVQCQDGAIQLGGLIEEGEGEGCTITWALEDYCEIIYQLHERVRIGQTKGSGTKRLIEKLNQLLSQVKSDVHEIETRTEAVFLPYMASMWDSLESVWKAAEEDPDCDAYVIPIPYYDKDPDGSFREVHYEGDQYPDYVTITDYNAYDFAARHPDMIFIHNPYDELNYITSVHPFFYTANLKKYTDKLVYIPYFILGEIIPDDKKAVEEMQHFCMLPGVVNADQVIVQSEDMRRIYIDVLTDAMGEDTRKHWEDTIMGIGSPKFDKVADTRKEDLEIPEEWLEIIRKPDGNWKKIILYNTSVMALVKHEDKMLAKMRNAFQVFKKSIDEVALWWRPHPLVKATIESMRPELWKEYKTLAEEYRTEGWGIYDDTADMNRAIAVSDAYYGDMSSLVQLYQKTGKPIMIQNVEVIGEKE